MIARRWPLRNTQRLAVIATAVLLSATAAAPWIQIDAAIRHVFVRDLIIGSIAVFVVAHVLFMHPELMAAALVPAGLAFGATLGVLAAMGFAVSSANWQWVLMFSAVGVFFNAFALDVRLRVFRRHRRIKRRGWAVLLIIGVLVEVMLLPPAPRSVALLAPISLLFNLATSTLILAAIAQWLLPSDSERLPPTLRGYARSTDVLARARSLYSYLDIPDEQYVAWKLWLDPIFRPLYAAVPQSAEVLDAGCGSGIMSNGLALCGPERRVVGVDMDPRKLRIARCAARTIPNVQFVSADLLEYEFPPSDCVLMIDMLHYWTPQKQSQLIAKAAASLRPGGVLIFREGLNERSWGHRLVHWGERGAVFFKRNPRGDGLRFQDRAFYVREFEKCGLQLRHEASDWGLGSNSVLLLDKSLIDAKSTLQEQT